MTEDGKRLGPPFKQLLIRSRKDLPKDLSAGLTVAVMGLPQAMAYALVAGVPPVYGLYTAMIPTLVAAIFGSSKHLITGPTNATCMVLFSLTATLPRQYDIGMFEVVLAITFLAGLFQFLFGLLQLGGVIRYVSNSVVVGFTAGAGVLIAVNQIKNVLGIEFHAGEGGQFLGTLWATLKHLPETNYRAVIIALATIGIIVWLKQAARWLPGPLIALSVVTLAGALLGWYHHDLGGDRVKIVRDLQEISPTFDLFHVPVALRPPDLFLLRDLAGGALAISLLGLIEAVTISRSIASHSGQRLDFNREFKSEGLANMVGSFFSCFFASGSFTRSALAFQSGGKTRMTAAISALAVGIIFFLFGPWANYIPQAGLAGILVLTAATMLDRKRLMMTWRSGGNSRVVLGGTLAATLVFPLQSAVFLGVALSIGILLRITGRPDLTQLVQHPESGFEEVPFNRAAPSPVAIINLEGDLYFAAAEDLDYELLHALRPETRVVVLRMKRLRAVGSSAMAMLEHFHRLLAERGIHLIVCGVEEEMTNVLTGSGVRSLIGEQNIFYADNRIFQSTELALARAQSIVDMIRAGQQELASVAQREALQQITVANVMQRRCLRFGARHQMREAMWLISAFQQKMKTNFPQTVFLQNEEGRLSGEVSLRLILRQLAAEISEDQAAFLDDAELVKRIGPRLFQSIATFALSDPLTLSVETPLATAFAKAARHRFRSMPIVDEHERLMGVFDELAMLRGLTRILQMAAPEEPSPSATEPPPEPSMGRESEAAREGSEP